MGVGLVTYACSFNMKINNKVQSWFFGAIEIDSLPFYLATRKNDQVNLFYSAIAYRCSFLF